MRNLAVIATFVITAGTAGLASRLHGALAARPSSGVERQDVDGKAVYLANCKQCHGVLGEPTKAAQRKYEKIATFKDAEFFRSRSDDSLRHVVRNGAGRDMKPFKDKLNPAEIDAVVKYIHTLARPAAS